MYTPILTSQIMEFVKDNPSERDLLIAILFFSAVFIVTFFRTVSENQLYYNFGVFGYNLSNSLSLLIYSKALRYPVLCEKKFTTSEIINYSQVDAGRTAGIGYNMTMLLFTPLQLVVGILLMYSFIGISFLSGIGVIGVTMICTFFIRKLASRFNDKLLKAKDKRLKITEEIFNIIKFIKVNAMEKYFFRKLD